MGIKFQKRKFHWNNNGITFLTMALVFMTTGLAGVGLTYYVESTEGSLIVPGTEPTFMGESIDFLWMVLLIIIAIVFLLLVLTYLFKKPTINIPK